MKKLILVYGVISGLVIIVINTLSLELGIEQEWLGFLVMFIAFSAIFVAVKQYRDETLGGVIRFGTGFLVGLGITVVASLVYVLVWELYLALTDYAFIDAYIQSIVDSRQTAGASQAELAATIAETETIRQQYTNPLFRLPMTFVEVFPVGVLISLVSAFVLRDSKTLAAE
jgi:uncharacterized membrane protein